MSAEDIESPPYPNEGVNPDGLFNTMGALRVWVLKYRDTHNALIGQDLIPSVKDLPNKKAYTTQPVITQYTHLLLIRRMREGWDHLVRNYEDDWDDKMCVRQRVVMLQSAALLLNSAFTPYEHREARRQRELEDLQQQFTRVQQVLLKQMEPQRHDPDPERTKGEG